MYFPEPESKTQGQSDPTDATHTSPSPMPSGDGYDQQTASLSPMGIPTRPPSPEITRVPTTDPIGEALLAREQLTRLDEVCPDHDPPAHLREMVRWQVERCLGLLETAKALINPRENESDRPLARKLKYTRSWSFPGYVKATRGNFEELCLALKSPGEATASKDEMSESEIDMIRVLTVRCLALHRVESDTEFQKAKQINVANAKMTGALNAVLGQALDSEARAFFQKAKRKIGERVKHAAAVHGADFKSCDSVGIDLETQMERAEFKCTDD